MSSHFEEMTSKPFTRPPTKSSQYLLQHDVNQFKIDWKLLIVQKKKKNRMILDLFELIPTLYLP